MVDLGLYVYNESDLVGKGSYGRVYKGTKPNLRT